MTKRTLGILVAAGIVLLGGGLVLRRKMQLRDLPLPGSPAQPVRTAQIKDGAVADALDTVALIQSDLSATVSAQVPGNVLEVRVHEGDPVKKGQILARLDGRTLQDTVDAATSRTKAAAEDLAKQKAIFERDQVLFEGGAISRQALDISRAQMEGAEAAKVSAERSAQSARTVLGYSLIIAPYAGVVRNRMVEPGDLATPGKPLFAIQAPGPVRMLSKLSQESLARLKSGGEVVFSDGARTLSARITRIYPALDASRLGSVESVLKAAPFNLLPGATVHARYHAQPAKGLVVPVGALLQGLQETMVVRVVDGKADPVAVTVASRGDQEATITGSVKAGDQVVVALPSELMVLTRGVALRSVAGVR